MKNYKVFSLLATTVLLTACPGKPHLDVSEPKFAEMGAEITVEQFKTDFGAAFSALTLSTNYETNPWGDMRMSNVASAKNQCEYKYGNVKAYDKSVVRNIESAEFDAETKVGLYKADLRKFDNTKDKNNTRVENEQYTSNEYYIEKVRIANKDYIASVYPDQRLVKTNEGEEIDETYTESIMFSFATYQHAVWILDFLALKTFPTRLAGLSEEELANYNFYKNGNIYTWLFNLTEENENSEVKEKIVRTAKQQIRFDGDSYEYASSTVYDCDREYLESVSDGNNDVRKKGDYDKLVKKEYFEAKYDGLPKNVHLEAVDYTDFDAEVDVLY